MSNYIEHAKREFIAIGYDLEQTEEDPNKWIVENVLELLEVFSKQGHSGSSAPFCIGYFEKLARFKPLSPLTGEDAEWNDVSEFGDKGTFQNNRCSNVFKNGNGAYDINGKVFREKNGACYTNSESRVPVEFPYVPKTEYVDVP